MEVKQKGTLARTPELQIAILRRISEKPGEDYQHLSSYLERKPNSVRAALSRLTRKGLVQKIGSSYYPYDDFDQYIAGAAALESFRPAAAPEPFARIAAAARYWVPAGMVLGGLLGYGLSQWL